MGRRASREIAMKLLYQIEIRKDSKAEQVWDEIEEYKLNTKDVNYVKDIVEGVCDNKESIDNAIREHAKGWKLQRISKVDLAILRLSIYEIYHREDIPINVSINEAIELAKSYSGEESSPFINGVLGGIAKKKSLPTGEGNT
ncbi:MAG: transcription antitermination factor NusB [Clostridium sp.]|nr:transcription antitermination factor NusB [Clostridium sp.]